MFTKPEPELSAAPHTGGGGVISYIVPAVMFTKTKPELGAAPHTGGGGVIRHPQGWSTNKTIIGCLPGSI